MKQIPAYVNNLPKKLTIRDKTKPLSSQKVGPENGQPRLTWLRHLVVPSRTRKC